MAELTNSGYLVSELPGDGVSQDNYYNLSAEQIAAPTPRQIQDLRATYRLNVAPFTEYKSNGTTLVATNTGSGSDFSGSYNDLTNKPFIPTTPAGVGLDAVDNTSDLQKSLPGNPIGDAISLAAQSVSSNVGYAGVLHDSVRGAQTYASTLFPAGLLVKDGDNFLQRVTAKGNNYSYQLAEQTTIVGKNVSGTFDSTSASLRKVSTIFTPQDSLKISRDGAFVTFTVTADGILDNTQVQLKFSETRTNPSYAIVWDIPNGHGSNTATLSMQIRKQAAPKSNSSVIEFVPPATGILPTSYPYASKKFDVNTAANLNFFFYFKFNSSSGAVRTLTSIVATAKINPPLRMLNDGVTVYRNPADQPFPSDDIWNLPSRTGGLIDIGNSSSYNFATTGNTTTGTINAVFNAGSDIVELPNGTGTIAVGEYPWVGVVSASQPAGVPFTLGIDGMAGRGIFKPLTRIKAIVDSTHVQLTAAVKQTITLRGMGSGVNPRMFGTWKSPESIMIKYGRDTGSEGTLGRANSYGIFTGTRKNGVPYATNAIYDRVPVVRISEADPVKRIFMPPGTSKLVAFNTWTFDYSPGTTFPNGGEDIQTMEWYSKMPVALNYSMINNGGSVNSDKNMSVISENGNYSMEAIGAIVDNAPEAPEYRVFRPVVIDLREYSVPYILDRPEFRNGASYATRAYGGGLIGGQNRAKEFNVFLQPDGVTSISTVTVLESAPEIDAKMAKVANAFPHMVSMLADAPMMRSQNFTTSREYSDTGFTSFRSFLGQQEIHRPTFSGGTGYVAGDETIVNVTGGEAFMDVRVTVVAVNAGVPTEIFLQEPGMFMQLPTNISACTTTNLGSGANPTPAGTGLVINLLNLADGATRTIAQCFPTMSTAQRMQWPATVIDGNADNDYLNVIRMGAMFTVYGDLETEFKTARLASLTNANNGRYSYEYYALLKQFQNYYGMVTDVAYQTIVTFSTEVGAPANPLGKINASFGNVNDLWGRLVYVMNVTPFNKGTGGTLKAPMAAPLAPIGG